MFISIFFQLFSFFQHLWIKVILCRNGWSNRNLAFSFFCWWDDLCFRKHFFQNFYTFICLRYLGFFLHLRIWTTSLTLDFFLLWIIISITTWIPNSWNSLYFFLLSLLGLIRTFILFIFVLTRLLNGFILSYFEFLKNNQ